MRGWAYARRATDRISKQGAAGAAVGPRAVKGADDDAGDYGSVSEESTPHGPHDSPLEVARMAARLA